MLFRSSSTVFSTCWWILWLSLLYSSAFKSSSGYNSSDSDSYTSAFISYSGMFSSSTLVFVLLWSALLLEENTPNLDLDFFDITTDDVSMDFPATYKL